MYVGARVLLLAAVSLALLVGCGESSGTPRAGGTRAVDASADPSFSGSPDAKDASREAATTGDTPGSAATGELSLSEQDCTNANLVGFATSVLGTTPARIERGTSGFIAGLDVGTCYFRGEDTFAGGSVGITRLDPAWCESQWPNCMLRYDGQQSEPSRTVAVSGGSLDVVVDDPTSSVYGYRFYNDRVGVGIAIDGILPDSDDAVVLATAVWTALQP